MNLACKLEFQEPNGKYTDVIQAAKNRWVCQIYAYIMSKIYRQLTCSFNAPPLFFVPPLLYELETQFMGTSLIYAEPLIGEEAGGEWQKYTNNYDYMSKHTMTSFTHFSHHFSHKLLMITDLQGKGHILTDPAIHSQNYKLFQERTNFGEKGIMTFYASKVHTNCNEICKKLHLERPECSEEEITYEQAVEESYYLKPDDMVAIICELCYQFDKVKYSVYKDRITHEQYGFAGCNYCEQELKKYHKKPCLSKGCDNVNEYIPYYY